MKTPTEQQVDIALFVLLWLYERQDDGQAQQAISLTRHLLEEVAG